jgi:hypothetical protein
MPGASKHRKEFTGMFWKTLLISSAALGFAGCHTGEKDHAHDKAAQGSPGHDHAHGDPDKAAASLRLDDGKKWHTDAPLRAGMRAIRDELQAGVQPIHAKTFSPDDYKRLAGKIEKEIGGIVQSCKLPKEVDDQLHLVLAQISAGTELMKKDGDRMAGAVKVIQGLESYAKFFEHPEWKPIEH